MKRSSTRAVVGAGHARSPRTSRLATSLAAASIVFAVAIAPAASAQVATKAVRGGSQAQGPIGCFWDIPEANLGAVEQLGEIVGPGGQFGPDTNTVYYLDKFQLPPGSTVTLHGQFPHSRFMSFTTYKVVNGEAGIVASALEDEDINPDPGSVNPFRAGESRTAKHRSYTITVSGEVAPEHPAANTLYVGQEGKTGETQTVELELRLYRTDKNLAVNGGVPLPAATYNPAEGTPVSEEAAVCSDLSSIAGPTAPDSSHIGVPSATYIKLRSELPGTKEPATHPAANPIRWERFFNAAYLAAGFYRGTAAEALIPGMNSALLPGFYPTPANAYMTAFASRLIGPNAEGHNILVLHAKMPTHPATYAHDKVMEGGTQVRYWSLCNYTAISKNTLLEAGSPCLFDEQVPTNIHDEYTIVVSLPEDRPKIAEPGCGVAWMNWGTVGDKEGRPDLDFLAMRNQLSNPTFEQSIEKVQHPGEEETVMGSYYPHGTYMTKQEFEARKCWSANA